MTCERAKANAGRNADYVALYLRSAVESVDIPTGRHITNSTTLHTKRFAFAAGLAQHCTDIIRFSHGASSSKKVYRSSFIPGLHDVCMIFEKAN
jgi:hypothetical protein